MPVISITTDFGQTDGFVGIMKGVIAGINPHVSTIDISHEIEPGDIEAGAWILRNAYAHFPAGTVHLAVVDPGVGTKRRPIIVRSRQHTFVLPDNGLISRVIADGLDWQVLVIDKPQYWLPAPSNTFHGRDIFAPIAAHLSKGTPAEKLGSLVGVETLVRLREAPLAQIGSRISGEVVYIDRFGNLITNIPGIALKGAHVCVLGETEIALGTTYGSATQGEPVAIEGSHGFVEIGVCQGRACDLLNAVRHARVVVE